jgi:hypothetical protein
MTSHLWVLLVWFGTGIIVGLMRLVFVRVDPESYGWSTDRACHVAASIATALLGPIVPLVCLVVLAAKYFEKEPEP